MRKLCFVLVEDIKGPLELLIRICLCELMLSLEWFDSYELDENEVITIPTSGIYHCLHCYNDGQSISMNYNNKKEVLNVEFTGEKTVKKSFDLITIDSEGITMDIPDIEYSVDVEMKAEQLNKIGSPFKMSSPLHVILYSK